MSRRLLILAVAVMVALAALFFWSQPAKQRATSTEPPSSLSPVVAPHRAGTIEAGTAVPPTATGRPAAAPVNAVGPTQRSGQSTPRMPVDPTLNVSPSS